MLYGFVNQSGGHVRVDSVLDEGTTVHIFLPRAANETKCEPDTPSEELHAEGKGQTVLLVEDEGVIRNLVADVLEQAGYTCIPTENGDDALKVIEGTLPIDLLVTDVGLPGLNGKQVAGLARQYRPHLKVLFITGYAAGVNMRGDLVGENMDLLLKPFEMDTLVNKVSEMIEENAATQ
jgi:DNA-binding NtrC family response regulator